MEHWTAKMRDQLGEENSQSELREKREKELYEQDYKTRQEPLALKLRVERQARDLSEERKQKVGNEREQRELRYR